MEQFDRFEITLITMSSLISLFALIITIRLTQGWLTFFKEYSNVIKQQLYTSIILLLSLFYPITVTLYICIGYYLHNTIFSTILWLFVLSSFFVFRIIRLLQSEQKNKEKKKKYIKECLLLLLILNCLWIIFHLISIHKKNVIYIKITLFLSICITHAILFFLCQKGSISVTLNRDPLKYVYIEKEPLYASLLSHIQCKKLVFRWIHYNSFNLNLNFNSIIPKVVKQLCFRYTFIDHQDNACAWKLLHGRKLKKDKVDCLESISKLLFIEVVTGIGMYLCSMLHGLKVLFIQHNLVIFICQILLYFILIATLITFAMMPTFNSIFYNKLCCKFHNFVEKKVLSYLDDSHGNNDSYHRRSRISRHTSRRTNITNDFVEEGTLLTELPSFIATSNIITELHLESIAQSKQKESTIDERHSLKLAVY